MMLLNRRLHKLFTLFIFFSFSIFCETNVPCYKVGLLIVATGKYLTYAEKLIESAKKYFCTNHSVTYFIFTDGKLIEDDNIRVIKQERLGWPYDTMMRPSIYFQHRDVLKDMDYLFASDADMLFVDDVGDEILSDLVGTQHPGFVGKRGSYEKRRESTACVLAHEGKHYFAGGFNGGKRDCYLQLCKTVSESVKKDLDRNPRLVAIWHDESHINRYFIDNPPTCILSPSYCYPESLKMPYPKKLLALDKNHTNMRK